MVINMFDKIDFKNGIVTLCDNSGYKKEDLLQVRYKNDILIDLGWYKSAACFIIYVIEFRNWHNPKEKYCIKKKNRMLIYLQKMIDKYSGINI